MNFTGLEALITAIRKDIADAEQILQNADLIKLRNDEFFETSPNTTTNGIHTNGHST